MRRFGLLAATLVTGLLAACSALPFAEAPGRNLDYLDDDLADLLIAFDLPPSLEPLPGQSILRVDLTNVDGEAQNVAAVLEQSTSGTELAGTLPAPADGHNYYLFELSDTDRIDIRAAQSWARLQPPAKLRLDVSLSPRLCRTGPIDADRINITVLAALPNARIAPLIPATPLRQLLKADATSDMPPCAGHSG